MPLLEANTLRAVTTLAWLPAQRTIALISTDARVRTRQQFLRRPETAMNKPASNTDVLASLEFDRDQHGNYDVLIDKVIRYRIVQDKQWPNFWSLHPATEGAIGRAIATECEHWDLITQLEHGKYLDTNPIGPRDACWGS